MNQLRLVKRCDSLHDDKAPCTLTFPLYAQTHGRTNLGLSRTPFPRAQHHLAWCTAAQAGWRMQLFWVTRPKGRTSTANRKSTHLPHLTFSVITPIKLPLILNAAQCNDNIIFSKNLLWLKRMNIMKVSIWTWPVTDINDLIITHHWLFIIQANDKYVEL